MCNLAQAHEAVIAVRPGAPRRHVALRLRDDPPRAAVSPRCRCEGSSPWPGGIPSVPSPQFDEAISLKPDCDARVSQTRGGPASPRRAGCRGRGFRGRLGARSERDPRPRPARGRRSARASGTSRRPNITRRACGSTTGRRGCCTSSGWRATGGRHGEAAEALGRRSAWTPALPRRTTCSALPAGDAASARRPARAANARCALAPGLLPAREQLADLYGASGERAGRIRQLEALVRRRSAARPPGRARRGLRGGRTRSPARCGCWDTPTRAISRSRGDLRGAGRHLARRGARRRSHRAQQGDRSTSARGMDGADEQGARCCSARRG